jgi:uncharacterized membrane protein YukC
MDRSLTDISGIGPATAEVLLQHGFNTIELIANTTTVQLIKVPGFSVIRANTTIQNALVLVAPAISDAEKTNAKLSKTEPKVKKVKKDKKPSKDKKLKAKKDKKSKEKKQDKKDKKAIKVKKTKKAKKK